MMMMSRNVGVFAVIRTLCISLYRFFMKILMASAAISRRAANILVKCRAFCEKPMTNYTRAGRLSLKCR